MQNTLQAVYRRSFKKAEMNFDSDSAETKVGENLALTSSVKTSTVDASAIRNMSRKDIKAKLLKDISLIVSTPSASISTETNFATMMDSLSLSQFKGFLETNYAIKLSDEYLFRENSNINKLVEIIKVGHAADDVDGGSNQQHALVQHGQGGISAALGCPPGVCCTLM